MRTTKEDILVKEQSKYLEIYKELDLMGRLHTDISFQGRSLLGGCKLIIRILLNKPKFYMNAKVHKSELEILEVSLFAHRSKVTQDLVEAHNIALNTSNVEYPITMSKVEVLTVHAGTYDACLDNIHSGQLPRRVFVWFVSITAFCEDYNSNPFKFEHFNNHHWLYIWMEYNILQKHSLLISPIIISEINVLIIRGN